MSRVTDLGAPLAAATRRRLAGVTGIGSLQRLSGGASNEIWSFDAEGAAALPLILRRRPGGSADATPASVALRLETEAELLRLAGGASVPVPGVRFVLESEDGLGSGYVMDRLAGETLARKILRDDEFASVRPRLARQCGEILARIHAIPRERLPELPVADAAAQLAHYRSVFDSFGHPHPVFELAFRFIAERLPGAVPCRLVHGDFRNGNLLIAPEEGVRGVLDWEIAHLGDPMEDLGWISVNSWRFGAEPPVGGFGTREDLFAGYTAGGGTVDPQRVHFWEVFGTLKWGIMCMMQYGVFDRGVDRSVERAAIGRRSSETEIDLLELLT